MSEPKILRFRPVTSLTDPEQIRLTLAFSLLHNLSNVFEYIQVKCSITNYYINYPILLFTTDSVWELPRAGEGAPGCPLRRAGAAGRVEEPPGGPGGQVHGPDGHVPLVIIVFSCQGLPLTLIQVWAG